MEKYESKQAKVLRPAQMIYSVLSDFSNFTPIIQDKVEEWSATEDSCSFKVKSFSARLRMVEKEPFKVIKIGGDQGSPFEFYFWIQLHEVSPADTRIRLVLHAELNMMLKMMIGGKIQDALDTMVEKIAESFNNAPI